MLPSRRSLLAILALPPPSHAQLGEILGGIFKRGTPLGESKLAAGLKEALRIGTDRAVDLTGAPNGFFLNAAIKILLPEPIRKFEKSLRLVGLGRKLDDFILSMNQAAEKATPAARSIFQDALAAITIADARQILSGGDTAATAYFQTKTSSSLAAAFQPAIESAMASTQVLQKYKQFERNLNALSFGATPKVDLVAYVLGKSIQGLFFMLGQEEKKIRTDPAARLTPLLKEVFSRSSSSR